MNLGTYKIEDYQIITKEGNVINKKMIIYYNQNGVEDNRESFFGIEYIRQGYTPQ